MLRASRITRQFTLLAAAFALAASPLLSLRADNIDLAPDQLQVKGKANVSLTSGTFTLKSDTPHEEAGFVLKGPGEEGVFDLSRWKYLAVDIENVSKDKQMRLLMQLRADSENKKHRDTNLGIALNPGEKRTLRVLLPHQWQYGAPDDTPGVRYIDTAKVKDIAFYMQWPYERPMPGLLDCKLSNLRVEEPLTPGQPMTAEQYIPFIDEYGQFIHAEWPTKIKSADDLKRLHAEEVAELAADTRPAQWDKYGGWAQGPQLKATGNFRVEKYEGKWWFVTPEGRLFFSHGIDVVSRYNDPLKVMPGHEDWFKAIPEGETRFMPTERVLREKYGTEDYQPEYFANVTKRLQHWGINTFGNWSNRSALVEGKTPYTLQLTDHDGKMPKIEGSTLKMYDVFDPVYVEKMQTMIPRAIQEEDSIIKRSLTDPMCIGYFIDNELNFGNREDGAYIKAIFQAPSEQAAKIEFVNQLKKRYSDIGRLNTKWKTSYDSWDGLLKAKQVPKTKGYKADGEKFFELTVDRYFKLARAAVKDHAPHRLYLGCRFVGTDAVRKVLYEKSKQYCDVLTVNIYSASVANFPVADFPDMPVLIGEFHFGLLQRGMFNASLCQAGATPEDRGLAYTRFLQGALVHPNIVGTHWFQYRDQPLTGRGDGEAYQIGFVDVTDIPYPEMVKAAREVGENLYTYRSAGRLTNSMEGDADPGQASR